jgi:hypothetical protein
MLTVAAPVAVHTVHAEALACATDAKRFAKMLKQYLRVRTGIAFSVRAGKGTASEWVRVKGADAMTEVEDATLRALFPSKHAPMFGLTIASNERVAILCAAAGVPTP